MAFEASTAAVVVLRHVHLGLLVDTDNCKNAIGLYYTASSHIETLGSTSNEYTVSRALRRRYRVNFYRRQRRADPKRSAAARRAHSRCDFLLSYTFFKRFSAKNFYYKYMRVSQLILAVVLLEIS